MPVPRNCSQIIFLIFRHPMIPLFQQSMKSDPQFRSVKIDQCLCIKTSKIRKHLLKWKKKFVSDFTQILCVRTFDHKDFKFWFFFSKKNFSKFFHFFLMLEDPQKILTSKISNFLEKNFRSSFTGSWQIPKGTKSWILMNLVLGL